ncbi:hypothetical protein BDK51DRAFT_25711 [Blyttiomyces helicus]|uniref:Uncharacterized protein n=1 Tax=Blyttiomyces helicus TaxID=388810 RepID=A0A4P9W5Z5_9FUNG|nr:hypothetical protein BDK51DRAFT_25711 [Blyttiomyces helicus]|eukprot:RKO87859.1 hypothetical protein BDK51DRAFT_25711 [Blyttiomyces helicus]
MALFKLDLDPLNKWPLAYACANPVPRLPPTNLQGILDFDSDDDLSDLEEEEEKYKGSEETLQLVKALPQPRKDPRQATVTEVRHVDGTKCMWRSYLREPRYFLSKRSCKGWWLEVPEKPDAEQQSLARYGTSQQRSQIFTIGKGLHKPEPKQRKKPRKIWLF